MLGGADQPELAWAFGVAFAVSVPRCPFAGRLVFEHTGHWDGFCVSGFEVAFAALHDVLSLKMLR